MKITVYVFLGALLALLLTSFVAAANDQTDEDVKPNQVEGEKYGNGGGGYGGGGNGGGGYGGGSGGGGNGNGGYGNGGGGNGGWGGRGGGGGGWGGPGGGGGGWGGGGGGCRYGRCCRQYGGCRCCYTAQEALAYMQN